MDGEKEGGEFRVGALCHAAGAAAGTHATEAENHQSASLSGTRMHPSDQQALSRYAHAIADGSMPPCAEASQMTPTTSAKASQMTLATSAEASQMTPTTSAGASQMTPTTSAAKYVLEQQRAALEGQSTQASK